MKNGVTKSLHFFFFENAKNVGRSDDCKRRKKKRMAIIRRGNSTVQKDSAMRSQCAHLLSVGGEEKDRGDWAIRKNCNNRRLILLSTSDGFPLTTNRTHFLVSGLYS